MDTFIYRWKACSLRILLVISAYAQSWALELKPKGKRGLSGIRTIADLGNIVEEIISYEIDSTNRLACLRFLNTVSASVLGN